MDIRGKTVVITGAAAGIGRATALRFAERGAARLIIADLDDEGMAETARLAKATGAEIRARPPRPFRYPRAGALAEWPRHGGGYDVLHNNAGVVSGAPQFPEAPVARLRWIIDINLTAVVVATQAAAQMMRRAAVG